MYSETYFSENVNNNTVHQHEKIYNLKPIRYYQSDDGDMNGKSINVLEKLGYEYD